MGINECLTQMMLAEESLRGTAPTLDEKIELLYAAQSLRENIIEACSHIKESD